MSYECIRADVGRGRKGVLKRACEVAGEKSDEGAVGGESSALLPAEG
jgi:hypothetical protein